VQHEKSFRHSGSGRSVFPFSQCRLCGSGACGSTGSCCDSPLSDGFRKAVACDPGWREAGARGDYQWPAVHYKKAQGQPDKGVVSWWSIGMGERDLSLSGIGLKEKAASKGRLFYEK